MGRCKTGLRACYIEPERSFRVVLGRLQASWQRPLDSRHSTSCGHSGATNPLRIPSVSINIFFKLTNDGRSKAICSLVLQPLGRGSFPGSITSTGSSLASNRPLHRGTRIRQDLAHHHQVAAGPDTGTAVDLRAEVFVIEKDHRRGKYVEHDCGFVGRFESQTRARERLAARAIFLQLSGKEYVGLQAPAASISCSW